MFSKPRPVTLPLPLPPFNVMCDDTPAFISTFFIPPIHHPRGDWSERHCSLFREPQRPLNMHSQKLGHPFGL